MKPLQKGIISKNDLHQILPHPMRVLTCTLDGENLERLILEMEKTVTIYAISLSRDWVFVGNYLVKFVTMAFPMTMKARPFIGKELN